MNSLGTSQAASAGLDAPHIELQRSTVSPEPSEEATTKDWVRVPNGQLPVIRTKATQIALAAPAITQKKIKLCVGQSCNPLAIQTGPSARLDVLAVGTTSVRARSVLDPMCLYYTYLFLCWNPVPAEQTFRKRPSPMCSKPPLLPRTACKRMRRHSRQQGPVSWRVFELRLQLVIWFCDAISTDNDANLNLPSSSISARQSIFVSAFFETLRTSTNFL